MRVLQTLIAFSGNAPPQLAVTRRLVERGHDVRVLAHEAARARIERTGASFVPFRVVYPDMDLGHPDTDPVRDWEARSAMGAAARMRNRGIIQPLSPTAREVSEQIDRAPVDAVIFDFLLLGAGVAAEAAGVQALALVHCPYPLPARGVPPLGTGLRPARGRPGRIRESIARRLSERFYAPVRRALNATRSEFGLSPLRRWGDQLLRPPGMFVLTAPELDFASRARLPDGVHFAGPAFEPHATSWESPWPADTKTPLILISLSTSYMNQERLANRILEAVADLPVRALLTTGPALDGTALSVPANTHVTRFAPHQQILSRASLVITHAGWGTVTAALAAGVPLVCIPDGRDQPDNAARVLEAGAGVRLRKDASPAELRDAITRALADDGLRRGAARIAAALGRRDGAATVANALEGAG